MQRTGQAEQAHARGWGRARAIRETPDRCGKHKRSLRWRDTANVLFSGSSVVSVGVNEIVIETPSGIPRGNEVPITIEIGGVVSRDDVTLAIE